MKSKNRFVALYLTGGLGNQLFQFAAAMFISNGGAIRIYECLGKPRINSQNVPEIYSFNLDNISVIQRSSKQSEFVGRVCGYLLRSNIRPNYFEKFKFVCVLSRVAAALVQSIMLRILLLPVVGEGVGYSRIKVNPLLEKFMNLFLIGYFQSSIWPEEVKPMLMKLDLKSPGPELLELNRKAEKLHPIIIHIRRGDYREESTFGLPDQDYYEAALNIIDKKYSLHPIWVFSDEIETAKTILNWIPQDRVHFISNVDQDSSSSLMAMRLGCAYIIANSTFSWWGAFLSYTSDPIVVAPDPWFTGQEEPSHLIPDRWIRMKHG